MANYTLVIQNANLEHYSTYPEHQLIPTANLMLNYILRPPKHESLNKKYASKKFMKVSRLFYLSPFAF